ncbi:hypothetical protein [Cupriavidus basilensis]|uniref:hypothetical protein n=1 Tax=Cupriavidus basilensis TaxID=68895 RepID=UPI0020A6A38F|nr:hypothetical protein [Cupriavidus basilensis]MCP3022364.1 hypothetical protein [Cupriavidus basilensis]
MLSRRQWQWFADHHDGIRWFCSWAIVVVIIFYFIFIVYVVPAKVGKLGTTYISQNENRVRSGCIDWEGQGDFPAARALMVGRDKAYIGFSAPSIFQRKYTVRYDSRVLDSDSVCFSEYLLDQLISPKQNKIILVDKSSGKDLYVIDPVSDFRDFKLGEKP